MIRVLLLLPETGVSTADMEQICKAAVDHFSKMPAPLPTKPVIPTLVELADAIMQEQARPNHLVLTLRESRDAGRKILYDLPIITRRSHKPWEKGFGRPQNDQHSRSQRF